MKWFVAAILVLTFALVFNMSLLAYAMYALLLALVISRLLTRSWANHLEATREVSQRVAEVGDIVSIELRITNTGRLPIPWVLVEDLLPRSAIYREPTRLLLDQTPVRLAMLWAGQSIKLNYALRCQVRGYYQLGPTVLETGDFFGLHRKFRVATEPAFLTVYPEFLPVEGFDISSKRPIGEVRMTYRLFEDPTRIAGVREYQAGDSLNRVHWPATARTGLLHSKVYEPSTVAGATLLLDFHRESYPAHNEPIRSELAVTGVCSVANALYEMGQQVGLISNGRDALERVRHEGWKGDQRTRAAAQRSADKRYEVDRLRPVIVPTRKGTEQLMTIRESLACLELAEGLKLPDLILETSPRMPRDASVIVFLTQVTTEHVLALEMLRQQGFAVSAILNVHEYDEFAILSGPLIAHGIDTFHLRDRESIQNVCRRYVLRS